MSSQTPVPLPDAAVPPPGQTGVAEPTDEPDGGRRILHEMLSSSWLVSVLAVVLALILGGLLIASQPTRGLDVGSIEFVHTRIVQERDNGTPVIIVSTELDEVLALADRILVMYRGRIVGDVPGGTDRDVLGLMMAGVPSDEALANASVTTQSEEDAALEAVPEERHEP